ncbi:MAG TPA: GyrI-like domain-containing protein [Verrucomicrobiae bacterium]|nr:GyrI-like domain-containing protein [Verrucomicrobiae bacterium]
MRVFICVLLIVGFAAARTPREVLPRILHEDEFSVVGIEVRTSNAKEMAGNGVIGKQWQRFFQEGVLQKIPNKASGNIYAIYSDYVSDRNGEYSFTLGAKVLPGTTPPAGFVLKKVPTGSYAVVTTETGPSGKVVSQAWQRVWVMEDRHELGGARAYRTDFELYDQRASDPQNAQVDLYIGLK